MTSGEEDESRRRSPRLGLGLSERQGHTVAGDDRIEACQGHGASWRMVRDQRACIKNYHTTIIMYSISRAT
jgi:hypothetical protein